MPPGRSVAAQPPQLPTHSPTSGIGRNVLANWLYYILVLASGFMLPRFIKEHQGQVLLGVWDFGWSLQVYVALLAMGVSSAVNRYVARLRALADFGSLNTVVNSSLVLLLASSVGGICLALGFAALVPRVFAKTAPEAVESAQRLVLILSGSAALSIPASVFNAVITGYERYDVLNLIRAIRDATVLGVMIALLVAGYGIVALALVVLAGETAATAAKIWAAHWLCPQLCLSRRSCSARVAGTMARFGGKSLLQAFARAGIYQANTILVGIFLGPIALAVYSRQRALVMFTMRFVKQYAQVFVARSSVLHAEGQEAALRELLVRSSKYGLFASLPLMMMLMILGGPLLNVWMGSSYEAPAVLAVMVLGHLAFVPQLGVSSILIGIGKHGRPALFELAGAALAVLLALVLLGAFDGGMIEAAVAMTLPMAITGGLLVPWYACRLLGVRPLHYIRAVASAPILAALPSTLCFCVSRVLFDGNPRAQLMIGLGSGGLFGGLIYWRWVLPSGAKREVCRVLRLVRVHGQHTPVRPNPAMLPANRRLEQEEIE